MSEEKELKQKMKNTFPDLTDFNNVWEEVKEHFIEEGKLRERRLKQLNKPKQKNRRH